MRKIEESPALSRGNDFLKDVLRCEREEVVRGVDSESFADVSKYGRRVVTKERDRKEKGKKSVRVMDETK